METSNNEFLKRINGDVWTDDSDNSEEAKAFYSKYWAEVLGRNTGLFAGDTILSFSTIAGCMIRVLPVYYTEDFKIPADDLGRLNIITESENFSESIKENFKKFYEIYQSLANFMPLIKPAMFYKTNKISPDLKQVKNWDYNEFPDLFFKGIKNYYIEEEHNKKFSADLNGKYLDDFGVKEDGWKNFVEQNYLQDFFKDEQYSDVKQLTPVKGIKLPYNKAIAKKMSVNVKDQCVEQVGIFVKNAVAIIEARAERLNK